MSHLIAIETYGSQRVRDPAGNGMISAYKIGYSTNGKAVLLALYGKTARDVTSKQASYHYVHLSGDTSVKDGYLLLVLTDEELQSVEGLTRSHLSSRTGIWGWRDGQWWRFPSATNPVYEAAVGRDGPRFNPSGYRPVAPATGAKADVDDGIYAERSQRTPEDKVWWWITGATYPHRELLKRAGCRWSKGRKAWYFIGAMLPSSVAALVTQHDKATPQQPTTVIDDAPCSDEEAERILGIKLAPKFAPPVTPAASNSDVLPPTPPRADPAAIQPPPPEPPQPEPIRVIKSQPLPSDDSPLDQVQTAIREAQKQPTPRIDVPRRSPGRAVSPIQQVYCGELTGSITGQVFCYGFAVYREVLLYLNLGGPRMAVEAIRARLSKGEIVNLVSPDAPALELSSGESDGKANTGMYMAYLQNLPEARFTSAILVHDWLTTPNYNGKAVTGILRTSEAQAAAKLLHHVRQLVNIPVFDEWRAYLYRAGQAAGLVRAPHPAGGIDVLVIELDIDAWTRLLTGGLANAVITLP